MSIRRQAYQWEIADLGQLPPKRLEALTEPQSIFTSGFGNANLKSPITHEANGISRYQILRFNTRNLWNGQRLGSGWVCQFRNWSHFVFYRP